LTNDETKPEVRLQISGIVKPRTYLSANVIRLTGTLDQEISQTVTILPSDENPFKVMKVEVDKGEYIRYEMVEIDKADKRSYQLTVFNTKKEKGWYMDNMFIKTDSQKTPKFELKVLGVIRNN